MWRGMSLRSKKATDLLQQVVRETAITFAPRLRSMVSCVGDKGMGKIQERRMVVPNLGIIVCSHFGSPRPIASRNSHYIFRTFLLAIPAVICIWVDILNWSINGITENLKNSQYHFSYRNTKINWYYEIVCRCLETSLWINGWKFASLFY